MARSDDLEQKIREAAKLLFAYEAQAHLSSDPREQMRCEKEIATQREHLHRSLPEYLRLCHHRATPPPTDIEELAVSLGVSLTPPPNTPATPPPAPATPAPNPFGRSGRIDDPAEFFDRDDLLRRIFEELGKGSNLSLVGEAQVGKSSLLAAIGAQAPQRLEIPCLYLDMQLIHDEGDFFEALCDLLAIAPCRGYRLARHLRGERYILCIDEIERMCRDHFSGDEREELRGFADGASAPLTLVIASRAPLNTLFPDTPGRSSPLANICAPLDVPPFTPQVARGFIAARLAPTGIAFTPAEIDDLLHQSGCHPARLQRAAADLYRKHTEER